VYIIPTGATGAWAGKVGQVAYFDQVWRYIAPREGLALWVNDEDVRVCYDGTAWIVMESAGGVTEADGNDFAIVVEGRLTLSTGNAVPSADVIGSTLYFTPYRGHRVALYDGSAWKMHSFTELSVALPATTGTNYDVWLYETGGMLALDLTAWSSDTSRSVALAVQQGVYVKTGAPTYRYLGTIRTGDVAGESEDSLLRRYVWNYYNRVQRRMQCIDTTTTHTYNTASLRAFNGNTNNRVEFVMGVLEDTVDADWRCVAGNSSATLRSCGIGIGLDSTAAAAQGSYNRFQVSNAGTVGALSFWRGHPGIGRHYFCALHIGAGADTQTWYGNSGFIGSTALNGGLWG